MKIIENKQTEIKDGKNGMLTYADFIKAICEFRGERGLSIEDIRNRLRIIEACGNGEIKLEDADFANLKNYAGKMQWAIIHKDIVEFDDYLKNIK